MEGIRREFIERAARRGLPEQKAAAIFAWMEGFSGYGFSAAHAASFAHLSYASAHMRTHHPAEFFCGLLNSQPMGFFSPRLLLNEARRIGLTILPPDAHLSEEGFVVEEDGEALRVGLSYCKGLSKRAVSSVISERRKRPFSSVADVYRRTAVERDALEGMIRAGFLDPLSDRLKLLEEAKRLPEKQRDDRQPEIPLEHPASWWESREDRMTGYLPLAETQRERMEWEVLSLNVSFQPLLPYRAALRELCVTPSEEIKDLPHGTRARSAGLFEVLQCPPTKSGRPVWFLVVEDEFGLLQATIFRSVYERFGDLLHHRGAFLLEGRVEQDRRKGFSFVVERIADLQEILAGTEVPAPGAVSGSGAFLKSRRRGRRAG